MSAGNVHTITRDDVKAAVDRVFDGRPWEDDANQMRAVAHLAEGILRTKEATLAGPGSAAAPATLALTDFLQSRQP